ncbi:DUF4097 family beta strand repeat-containing protein [Amycolatopsis sacchari]|uniref:Putative adhesin n=1 Tax=Amycolatopsis sacchari TaxID=115433 RepID=A0A1I3UMZ7_9PSEU|nr:DUF4097 family beta strand repeat-containing protein [Amycolatopsis sacchari]SFJ83127.1 Putative adhesin [Amycolatopsis sacchari]
MTVFTTPQPIKATVTTAGARVRVTAGERQDTVVLVEPGDRTNNADVKVAERVKVEFADGALSVKTTKSGQRIGSVDITIALPAGSTLVLSTARTGVHAEGRFGDCALDAASSEVRLDQVGALRGQFGSSRISVGQASSDVEILGSSGSVDLDRVDGDVVVKVSDCPIRIGRMTRGRAELANASGGIDVGIGDGAARVDANSTKGSVRSSVPARDDAAVQVHARTRLDDIVIHPAAV